MFEKKVREWADVRDEAENTGVRIHVGVIFGIRVEKGSELPEGSPGRNYEEWVVFAAGTSETRVATLLRSETSAPHLPACRQESS